MVVSKPSNKILNRNQNTLGHQIIEKTIGNIVMPDHLLEIIWYLIIEYIELYVRLWSYHLWSSKYINLINQMRIKYAPIWVT